MKGDNAMRKIFKILTPENVMLEYELAGLGSRFTAFLIDSMIQTGIIILVAIGMAIGQIDIEGLKRLDAWITATGIVLVFIVFFGYFIFFEIIMNGQSPGKKAVRLRVIKQTGEPVGFWESFLRNILRVADFLPSLNLVGAAFIVFSSNYKRIGDFAANTLVVKIKKENQPVKLENLIKASYDAESELKGVNVYPVNNVEYGILKEYLYRKDSLGKRKRVFTYHLNKYFMEKFNLEKPEFENPEEFFKEIVKLNSGV